VAPPGANRRSSRRGARLYTIGQSRHPTAKFVELLTRWQVAEVVDVRRIPFSRLNPQFNSDRLAHDLLQHGIAYRHMEDLGGLRETASSATSQDSGWRNPFFRSYAAHARTRPFLDALDALGAAASKQACAIMCAEGDWRQCHRQIIADYLIVRDFEPLHILADGSTEPARLTPFASVAPDGTLGYAGEQNRQLPLSFE
jgi:uncharacterized protein (DUF488 family)